MKGGFREPNPAAQSGVTSPYLAQQRAHLFAEIEKDPALKRDLSSLMYYEDNNPANRVQVLESLVNHAVMTNRSIKEVMFSGFYGPISKTKKVQSARSGNLPENEMELLNKAMALVRGGSDTIDMRTDQGMINEHKDRTGKKQIGQGRNANYFSYHDEKWSREQLRKKAEYDKSHPVQSTDPGKWVDPFAPLTTDHIRRVLSNEPADKSANTEDYNPIGGGAANVDYYRNKGVDPRNIEHVNVKTAFGTVTVAKEAADDFKGFAEDLAKAGAPC